MRLEIPHEQPRRHEGNDGSTVAADTRTPTRSVPDNPVHLHLHSREERADPRRGRPLVERRRRDPARDTPRERNRPVAAADPRRPARAAGNVVGLELRPEEQQLLREAGRFRVVRTADLRESLYDGKARPLENDLKYLRDKGLVETRCSLPSFFRVVLRKNIAAAE